MNAGELAVSDFFPPPYDIKEKTDARTQADDEGRQEGRGEDRHEGVQVGDAAQRVEGRAQGEEPQAGGGDRLVGVGPEAPQVRRKFRVFLHDGVTHDMNVLSWPDFIGQMIVCHGLLLERAWIPEHMIKLIAEIDESGSAAQNFSGNVVPLRRGP